MGPGFAATGLFCNNGSHQSPIDIDSCIRSNIPPLRTTGHSRIRPEGFTIMNTGSTAQINYRGNEPTMSGGPLPRGSTYVLVQAHFHWGESDAKGSEHAVHGKYGAMEAHFVHRKRSYPDLETLIYSILQLNYQEQERNNTKLDPIVTKLAEIRAAKTLARIDADALFWLNDALSPFRYYNYPGSLTTGDCNEVVNWIVMKKRVGISATQIAEFRKLIGKDGMAITEYRREVQDLNNRKIKCPRVFPMV
ncbi:carbonic anhydrase 2-like [Cloeon dipterum]|uniref:carbonic anhydrase 2-like n=1 Tax=Cloeon dipterum TaxID=197152 RepID=UPI00321FD5B4